MHHRFKKISKCIKLNQNVNGNDPKTSTHPSIQFQGVGGRGGSLEILYYIFMTYYSTLYYIILHPIRLDWNQWIEMDSIELNWIGLE